MNSHDHLDAADLTKTPSLKAYQLAPTLRTEHDYASDRAIVRHVGNYICDILEDLNEEGNIDGVVEFLKGEGYKVEKY